MQWMGGRRSTNIEDRRGMRPVMVGGGLGAIILTLIALYFGVEPGTIVNPSNPAADSSNVPVDDSARDFAATVLGYTEDTWNDVFREAGRTYTPPKLVLFSGAVESACGLGQAAMGPFYCPSDQKVYLDLSFFRELDRRFGAPGDFAQAYVVAHEVGHHVQTLLGINRQVQEAQQGGSRAGANALSVKLELQADCFAGVWGHHASKKQLLDSGDVDEGLSAAAAIGDDRLTGGRVSPESFTHGTSQQRAQWLRQGLQTGDINSCDTFRSNTY